MNIHGIAARKLSLLAIAWSVLSGCEAPLDLSGVQAQREATVRRFDQFKSAIATENRVVVAGDNGAILTSRDKGESWNRTDLEGNPSLIDITACADGTVVALDRARKVWISKDSQKDSDVWVSRSINSEETPMAITCDPQGRLWVTASFSTILSSNNRGQSWESVSMDEDMQLGTIQFVSENYAVVTGEFGAFFVSRDGGQTWDRDNELPDEFFPLAAYFIDEENGWVSGLSGTVLSTQDGGASWQRQPTSTQSPLYGLVGQADRVYAAGDGGALLQLADGQWVDVEHESTARSYYIAMAPLGDKQLLVAGGSGALNVIAVSNSVSITGSVTDAIADKGTQLPEGAKL